MPRSMRSAIAKSLPRGLRLRGEPLEQLQRAIERLVLAGERRQILRVDGGPDAGEDALRLLDGVLAEPGLLERVVDRRHQRLDLLHDGADAIALLLELAGGGLAGEQVVELLVEDPPQLLLGEARGRGDRDGLLLAGVDVPRRDADDAVRADLEGDL